MFKTSFFILDKMRHLMSKMKELKSSCLTSFYHLGFDILYNLPKFLFIMFPCYYLFILSAETQKSYYAKKKSHFEIYLKIVDKKSSLFALLNLHNFILLMKTAQTNSVVFFPGLRLELATCRLCVFRLSH